MGCELKGVSREVSSRDVVFSGSTGPGSTGSAGDSGLAVGVGTEEGDSECEMRLYFCTQFISGDSKPGVDSN